MCTVALAFRRYPGLPLLLAANRDENLKRPAEGLAVRRDKHPAILSPLDVQAGGTWLGLSARGVLVAVTNRFGHARDPARRSRGQVVLEALAASDAAEAAGVIAALAASSVNPFHLLIADSTRGFQVFHDGEALRCSELGPGWHVLTERSLAGPAPLRESKVRAALARHASAPSPEELHTLLRSHEDAPLDATCVHVPELDYGTRSTTIAYVPDAGTPGRLFHGEGPPCQNALVDRSALYPELMSLR
jgi:uncharacterized protein with NRDE domain